VSIGPVLVEVEDALARLQRAVLAQALVGGRIRTERERMAWPLVSGVEDVADGHAAGELEALEGLNGYVSNCESVAAAVDRSIGTGFLLAIQRQQARPIP